MAATKKRGRPTKYDKKFAEQAYKLTLVGMIDAQLADFFEVDESTINNWKKSHPDFLESIKKGKQIADAEVANSLFKRAVGYTIEERRSESSSQGSREVITIKEMPSDTTAQIFWLKNRQPDKWRDKPIIDSEEQDAAPVQIVVNVQDARKDDKPEP